MTFEDILARLVAAVPEARGAVVCDYEGEYVHLHLRGEATPFDVQLAGAQFSAVFAELLGLKNFGRATALDIRCDGATYLIRHVAEGYYALLWLGTPARAAAASRRLAATVDELVPLIA